MTYEEHVKKNRPTAELFENQDVQAVYRFHVFEKVMERYLGAGNTPEEAWRNASYHTDEALVKQIYPRAYVIRTHTMLAYNMYEIWSNYQYLGGGPTEGEAWQNARIHAALPRESGKE